MRAVTRFFVRLADRWMPDPLVIAVVLTFICLIAAVLATDFGPIDAVNAWGASFWNLLAFTMQMVLMLGLAHVAAHTKPVNRGLAFLADQIKSPSAAYAGMAALAGFLGLFSWGLALIVPAVMSRILAQSCKRRGVRTHFPLIVASGWLGASTSMQGLSSSIPLTINTPGHFLEDQIGLIPLSATILTPWSLVIVFVKIAAITFLVTKLAPKDDEINEIQPTEILSSSNEASGISGVSSPSAVLENARAVTLALAMLAVAYAVSHFAGGGGLNLNTMNMCLLALGLALANSARHYLHLLGNAGRAVAPFVIQYPLYAGIMGVVALSGLGASFAGGFVAISDAHALPIWTFLSAGILNIFVPSAGGQWAVQGPIVVEAAQQLGADIPRVTMALTLGESWTNAIQPLYAIPVLAVAGLHVRDVMGYGVIILALNGVIYLTGLAVF